MSKAYGPKRNYCGGWSGELLGGWYGAGTATVLSGRGSGGAGCGLGRRASAALRPRQPGGGQVVAAAGARALAGAWWR
jgi:hypothetical protein